MHRSFLKILIILISLCVTTPPSFVAATSCDDIECDHCIEQGDTTFDLTTEGVACGDVVCIDNYSPSRWRLKIQNKDCSAGDPITVMNDPEGTTLVDLANGNSDYAIWLSNVKNLRLTGTGKTGTDFGIVIDGNCNWPWGTSCGSLQQGVWIDEDCDDIVVDHLEIYSTKQSAFKSLDNGTPDPSKILDGITIQDNYIHDTGTEAIYLGGADDGAKIRNVLVKNNQIKNICWDAIQVKNVTTGGTNIVEGNYVYDYARCNRGGERTCIASGRTYATGSNLIICNNHCQESPGGGINVDVTSGTASYGFQIYNNIIIDVGQSEYNEDCCVQYYGNWEDTCYKTADCKASGICDDDSSCPVCTGLNTANCGPEYGIGNVKDTNITIANNTIINSELGSGIRNEDYISTGTIENNIIILNNSEIALDVQGTATSVSHNDVINSGTGDCGRYNGVSYDCNDTGEGNFNTAVPGNSNNFTTNPNPNTSTGKLPLDSVGINSGKDRGTGEGISSSYTFPTGDGLLPDPVTINRDASPGWDRGAWERAFTFTLADDNATQYTKDLADRLASFVNQGVILGQEITSYDNEATGKWDTFIDKLYTVNGGKYPAMIDIGLLKYSYLNPNPDNSPLIQKAIQAGNDGFIVMVHWNPMNPSCCYSGSTGEIDELSLPNSKLEKNNAMSQVLPGGVLHDEWEKTLDWVAVYLQAFADEGIPVIFDAMGEMNTTNNWYGLKEEAPPYFYFTATASHSTILTDTDKNYENDIFIGDLLQNETTGYSCTVVDNTSTTITCSAPITGGWTTGDVYSLWPAKTTFTALWQDMFTYLTETKGLHNLIFAYTPVDNSGIRWAKDPGRKGYSYYWNWGGGSASLDEYVDIVGTTSYMDNNQGQICTRPFCMEDKTMGDEGLPIVYSQATCEHPDIDSDEDCTSCGAAAKDGNACNPDGIYFLEHFFLQKNKLIVAGEFGPRGGEPGEYPQTRTYQDFQEYFPYIVYINQWGGVYGDSCTLGDGYLLSYYCADYNLGHTTVDDLFAHSWAITFDEWNCIPAKPSIINPTPDPPETEVPLFEAAISSDYADLAGCSTSHISSDWEVDTDTQFGSPDRYTYDNATSKVTWTPSAGWLPNMGQYLRVRYTNANGDSLWSDPVYFETEGDIESGGNIGLLITGSNNVVKWSIVNCQNEEGTGIKINATATGNKIYNSNIVGCGEYGLNADEDVEMKNTILYNNAGPDGTIASGKTVTGSHNYFQDTEVVIETEGGSYESDTSDFSKSSPNFSSTYIISSFSPASNAGSDDIYTCQETDIINQIVTSPSGSFLLGNGLCIGASEYQATRRLMILP